jgi:uncharacterized protein YndB with AHSA1/START domain
MNHGTLSMTRHINAPRELVYEGRTKLEHRRHWFVGPAWTRFENGIETMYTARFHLIDPNVRLIYAFDMQVGGKLFSVSLAGVELEDASTATKLTYTEHGFFLAGEYGAASRTKGTNGLLDQFASYLETLRRAG